MAIARVRTHGSATNKAAATPVSVPIASTVPVGNLVLVLVATDSESTGNALPAGAVTDSVGNVYTQLTKVDPGSGTLAAGAVYASKITTQLTSAHSVTFSPNALVVAKAMLVEEFSGGEVTLSGTAGVGNGPGSTPTAIQGGTPAVGALVVGLVAVEGPNTDVVTGDGDASGGIWSGVLQEGTTGGTTTSNVALRAQWKILTVAAAQTYNPTIASRDWSAMVVGLMASASTITRTLTDQLGLADNRAGSLGRPLTDAMGLGDSVVKEAERVLTDQLSLADGPVALVHVRTITDLLGLVDGLAADKARTLTDQLSLGDTVERSQERQLVDQLGLTDSTMRDLARTISDAVGLSDTSEGAQATAGGHLRTITDQLGLTDTLVQRLRLATGDRGCEATTATPRGCEPTVAVERSCAPTPATTRGC